MHLIFIVVAVVLFAIDFFLGSFWAVDPADANARRVSRLSALGLAFFAASFWPGLS